EKLVQEQVTRSHAVQTDEFVDDAIGHHEAQHESNHLARVPFTENDEVRGWTLRDEFKESAVEAVKFRFFFFVHLPEQAEDLVEHLPVGPLDYFKIHGDAVRAAAQPSFQALAPGAAQCGEIVRLGGGKAHLSSGEADGPEEPALRREP